MADTTEIHVKLGTSHVRLLEKLKRKMGLDRTAIIKLALYKLGVEEGVVLDSTRDTFHEK